MTAWLFYGLGAALTWRIVRFTRCPLWLAILMTALWPAMMGPLWQIIGDGEPVE